MRLNHYEEPWEWAEHNFTGAEMSDVRRISRVITIAEAMASSPGSSIPEMFAHPYDVKAAYKLFRHPDATPANLQAGHRDWVLEQLHQPNVYLLEPVINFK